MELIVLYGAIQQVSALCKKQECTMKFLVISNPKHQVPPDMILPILEAFGAFLAKYTASGHIKESWSFAGQQGGGARIDADSLEELDAIMAENPLGGVSDIQVYPVVDLQESIQRAQEIARARMEAMAHRGGG